METLPFFVHIFFQLFVPNFHILYFVIVLRIVHAERRFYRDACLRFHVLSIDVSLMGMERTDAVRCVQKILLLLVGDDIYRTSQRICTQMGWNHTFVYFYTVDDIGWKICQCYAGAFGIKWYTI